MGMERGGGTAASAGGGMRGTGLTCWGNEEDQAGKGEQLRAEVCDKEDGEALGLILGRGRSLGGGRRAHPPPVQRCLWVAARHGRKPQLQEEGGGGGAGAADNGGQLLEVLCLRAKAAGEGCTQWVPRERGRAQ